MPIRPATLSDIPTIAHVMALSFGPDIFFRVLFPHQNEFPEDFVTMWRRRMYENWWDYGAIMMVSYHTTPQEPSSDDDDVRNGKKSEERIEQVNQSGKTEDQKEEEEQALLGLSRAMAMAQTATSLPSRKETITGVALWKREGQGVDKVWGTYGRFDPRHLIKYLIKLRNKIVYFFRPCRASAQPTHSDPNPVTINNYVSRTMPFIEPLLKDPEKPWRANHWDLVFLAIHPEHQGKGHGRELAEYGVKKAKEEKVSGLVISAPGKEGFYEKIGFRDLVGYMTKDLPGVTGFPNPNPLGIRGVDGGAVMWFDS